MEKEGIGGSKLDSFCDQLWILDRVCQKYPKPIFFLLLFWLCGCLELLNRKARAIREQMKEDLGECNRKIHTHLRRKVVPCSRALGASRVWESFFIDFKNFRSEVALSYLVRQLGQSQDIYKKTSVSVIGKYTLT